MGGVWFYNEEPHCCSQTSHSSQNAQIQIYTIRERIHTHTIRNKKNTHTHHKVNECAPIKRLHSYVSSLQAKIILGTLMEYGEPMWLEVDIN